MSALSKGVIGLLSSFLLFSSFALAKDEPWKGKPYNEWDRKDLERIFTDSPWSRVATVTRTWLPISEKDAHDKMVSGSGRKLPAEMERANEGSVGGDLNINV